MFVESESRKIGTVQVADVLLESMRDARVHPPSHPAAFARALLKDEYAHFLADPDALAARLAHLVPLHGRATIERWSARRARRRVRRLVRDLLVAHYDPTYQRSIERNFPRVTDAITVTPDDVAPQAFAALAQQLLRRVAMPEAQVVA